MPVGAFLAGCIDALPRMLDEPCRIPCQRRPELSIGLDPEADRAPAAVVGRQDGPPRGIDRHGARPAATGRLVVELREHSRRRIDRQRHNAPGRLAIGVGDLGDRIEEWQGRMEGEVGGIAQLRSERGRGERAVGGVEASDVDPGPLWRGTGVGPEVDEPRRVGIGGQQSPRQAADRCGGKQPGEPKASNGPAVESGGVPGQW